MSRSDVKRIIVVDAEPIFRAGIREICGTFTDIIVIGEASRASDAFLLCERLSPDLVLIDGTLHGVVSLIAQLREHCRGTGIMLLARCVDETLLRRGLQLGIVGYLTRQTEAFDLVQAIRSAAGGMLTLAPEATALLAGLKQRETPEEMLSEREQEVLALLMQGYANHQIAAKLRVSRSTVKFHLRNIYSKLTVRSRAEALALLYGQRRTYSGRPVETMHEQLQGQALAIAL